MATKVFGENTRIHHHPQLVYTKKPSAVVHVCFPWEVKLYHRLSSLLVTVTKTIHSSAIEMFPQVAIRERYILGAHQEPYDQLQEIRRSAGLVVIVGDRGCPGSMADHRLKEVYSTLLIPLPPLNGL